MTEIYSGNLKKDSLTSLPFATNKDGKPVEKEHSDGGGLYLVVGPTGTLRTGGTSTRRWIFKFQWQGKLTRMGLGILEMVSLQEARRQAMENRKLVHAGKNPIAERDAAARKAEGAPTFKTFAAKIRRNATSSLSEKAIARWDRGVNVYAKSLHDKKIAEITRHDVVTCLEPIWVEIPVAAKKFQSQLKDIFNRAIAAELIADEVRNPADYDILKMLLDKQNHTPTSHRALPYRELPAAWQRIVEVESMASWTAQFIILTCVRTNEGVGALRSQIDLDGEDGARWKIPGKIMKNGLEADVPLSREAVALVRKMDAYKAEHELETDILFPGQDLKSTQSENTVLFFLQKQMGLDTTTHGCRTTFRTWGGDQKGLERETLEYCLHHIEGEAAELAYNKAEQWEKRQETLQTWANYATGKAPKPARKRPELTVVAA